MRGSWLAGIAASLTLGDPAAATPFFLAQAGTNSDSAVQCAKPAASGSSPVTFSLSCSNPDVGSFTGNGVASFGHLGSISQAETHTGFSFFSKVETIAEFRDELIFSSTDPAATFADVSPRLLLHGILDAAASAGFGSAEMVGEVTLDGQFFAFRLRNDSVNGFSIIQNNFSVTGTVGPTTDAVFTTPLIRVGLHTPVSFDLFMSTDAVAGSFGSAASDFGGSFKFVTGSDAFNVPDGVTVNAGSWLVDNRFVDPLSAVPEPASWALMILGFGVLGAGLRVQRAINPKGEWA